MRKQIILDLPDDLTVRSIAEFHNKLISKFKEFDEIIIDCAKISYCDISSIQLLASARKSAAANGLDFRVSGVAGALNAALERAGIAPGQLGGAVPSNGA